MLAGVEGLQGAHRAAWLQQQSANQTAKTALLSAMLAALGGNQSVSWNSGQSAYAPPSQSPTGGGGGGATGGSGAAPGLYERMIAEQKAQEQANSQFAQGWNTQQMRNTQSGKQAPG